MLYNKKLEQGASNRKVRLIHSALHHALNHALQFGMISRNTSQAVIKPKLIKKEMMVLDENQVQSFLLAARDSRHQMIYFLALATDLREGELLGLYWSDVVWVNRRIQIKRQLQRLP
jgi:integrase